MLGARYDLAIALDRDAAVGKSEQADQAGYRGPYLDAPSFPVHDDVEGPWHARKLARRGQ